MRFRGISTVALAAIGVMLFAATAGAATTGKVVRGGTIKVKTLSGTDSGGQPLVNEVHVRPAAAAEQMLFKHHVVTVGSEFTESAISVSDINPLKPSGRCGQAVDVGTNPNPNRVICDAKRVKGIQIYTNYADDSVVIDETVTKPTYVSTSYGSDSIRGGGGDDHLDAGPDQDWDTYGGGGDDRIRLGSGVEGGNEIAYGDAGPGFPPVIEGDDTIRGSSSHSELYGEGGDDNLDAGSGGSLIVGGTGADSLRGRGGDDILDATEDPPFADKRVWCSFGDTYLFDEGVDPEASGLFCGKDRF